MGPLTVHGARPEHRLVHNVSQGAISTANSVLFHAALQAWTYG